MPSCTVRLNFCRYTEAPGVGLKYRLLAHRDRFGGAGLRFSNLTRLPGCLIVRNNSSGFGRWAGISHGMVSFLGVVVRLLGRYSREMVGTVGAGLGKCNVVGVVPFWADIITPLSSGSSWGHFVCWPNEKEVYSVVGQI